MRQKLGAALALMFLLSACAGTATPPPADPSASTVDRAGLTALLTQWATALRTGDQQLLTRILDSTATPEFVRAQHERAHNLRGVPLQEWSFTLSGAPSVPSSPARAPGAGAAEIWSGPAELRYAITGADAAPSRRPVALTAARRGDRWLLVSDTDVSGRPGWRGPWDFGPLRALPVPVDGGHTAVVLSHPGQQAEATALAAELPGAVRTVNEIWGTGWAGTVLVIVAGSDAEFAQLASTAPGPVAPLGDVAAVAISDAVSPGSPPSGQRIIFSPGAAARLDAAARRSVLRHELTHVAARAVTTEDAALWLVEGFADYAGYRGHTLSAIAPAVLASPPSALPTSADFADPARAQRAYEISWAACAFIAAAMGEPQLVRFYRRGVSAPVAVALREVLAMSEAEFLSRWQRWLAGQR